MYILRYVSSFITLNKIDTLANPIGTAGVSMRLLLMNRKPRFFITVMVYIIALLKDSWESGEC